MSVPSDTSSGKEPLDQPVEELPDGDVGVAPNVATGGSASDSGALLGGAMAAPDPRDTSEERPERQASRSGEREVGASDGPVGGTAYPAGD
jgi:hypothetical protein